MRRRPELPERTAPAVTRALPRLQVLELPALERPGIQVLEDGRIRVGGQVLEPGQARALWAELGGRLEVGDQARRARAWAAALSFLDRDFRDAPIVRVVELGTRRELHGAIIRPTEARALVRLGPYQVATLAPRARPVWSGFVADYQPGPLATSSGSPDLQAYSTARRVAVRARDALEAPRIRSGSFPP